MATVTKGKTFISGETVEPADMHQLVDSATVTNIVDADIGSGAAIAASKLAATLDLSGKTVTLPDSNIGTAKIVDSAVTTAKINNAAVTAAKLDGAQTGSAPIYGCRAWVNFDGTSVTNVGGEDRCAIRASGNVSKVVRTGTGYYRVHFTAAMPDANYSVCGSAKNTSLSGVFYDSGIGIDGIAASDNFTMSLTRGGIVYPTWAGQRINLDTICAQVFR
jgi:hypothetical protein